MNRRQSERTALALLLAAFAGVAVGQKLGFNGQASGRLGFSRDTSNLWQGGLRYITSLSMALLRYVDAELSVNAFGTAQARALDSIDTDAKVKPHRLWARFSTARFEARAGLQKINFGSATLLRPLMWFDRIDPRDPLEMTDGVYGLLGRYCFQNNANLWAWGLIGNSSPKGWEQLGSERWIPEFGGRAQLPVPRGEVAATYHHRWVEHKEPGIITRFTDDRLGLDGKWDVGVGCWFEATLVRRGFGGSWENDDWQRMGTVGLDYTFGIGNGLAVLAEHMVLEQLAEVFGFDDPVQVSAAMVSYPLGLVDNLRGIVLYEWRNKGLYRFASWQRTLDNWLFSVAAFWNPDTQASFGAPGGSAAGKGVQLMVVYNH